MNGFRKLPKQSDKVLGEASKLIEAYLSYMKPILPKDLWNKKRTELHNICRVSNLSSKNLSGFLSLIKQKTEISMETH